MFVGARRGICSRQTLRRTCCFRIVLTECLERHVVLIDGFFGDEAVRFEAQMHASSPTKQFYYLARLAKPDALKLVFGEVVCKVPSRTFLLRLVTKFRHLLDCCDIVVQL